MALGSTKPLNRNDYQEYFLPPCHLHVLIIWKSWSLNLLEPSGPVQACTGIALPLHKTHTLNYIQIINQNSSMHASLNNCM
jgi:hypothetical protein